MNTKKYDFAIIGGGILGTSFAFHLLKKGYTVALFDRDQSPQQASVRNFGQVVPSGFGAEWQKYGIASMEIYKSIQKEAQLDLKEEGSLYIASDDDELKLLEELNAINCTNQYDSVLLNSKEIEKLYPEVRSTYAKGGLYFPLEIQVNPRSTVSKILQWLQSSLNLHYYSNSPVTSAENSSNGTLIKDSRGKEFIAERVFVCTGHDFKTLFPSEYDNAGLKTVKLQMISGMMKDVNIKGSVLTGWSIRRYESFQECPSYQEIAGKEDKIAFHKQHGIHILAKQERDGTLILGDSHHYTDHDADLSSPSFDEHCDINNFIIEEAKKILKIDAFKPQLFWSGYYSQCSNSPILIKNIDENTTIITGIGGKGMTASFGFVGKYLENL